MAEVMGVPVMSRAGPIKLLLGLSGSAVERQSLASVLCRPALDL